MLSMLFYVFFHRPFRDPCPSPMVTHLSLSLHDGDPFDNPALYRMIVGALQYATITRPDLAFAVNKVSQFMHSPTTSHWAAVKRILRYINGTLTHGICIKPSTSLTLHAYSAKSWAGWMVLLKSPEWDEEKKEWDKEMHVLCTVLSYHKKNFPTIG